MASNDIQVTLSASDKTSAAFASAKRNIAGLSTSAAGLTRTLGLAIPALTGAGFVAMAKSAIDTADALKDMGERTGVAVKDLASLRTAAEQNGTSLDAVAKGIQKLSLSFSQAQGGNKEMAESLKRLGVTSTDARTRLFQLADAYANASDKTRVLADIQKVQGKQYAELIPLLAQGGDELRKSAEASETFANAMARLAPDADKFNDQLAQMKTNAAGLSAQMVSALLPSLNEYLGALQKILKEGSALEQLGFFTLGYIPARILDEQASSTTELGDRIAVYRKRIHELQAAGKDASEEIAIFNNLLEKQIELLQRPPKRQQSSDNAAEIKCVASGGTWDGAQCIKKPTRPTADPLSSILAGTDVAKVAEFDKLMGLLNARFAAGKIGAEQHRQATAKLFTSTFASDIDKVNKALEYNAETERMVAEHLEETKNVLNDQKQAWIDAGRAIEEEFADPSERLAARLAYLDELFRRGVLGVEAYHRAYSATFDDIGKSAPTVAETSDLFDQLGTTITAAMGGLAEGGKSASDVMKDLAASIIKVVAQVLILEPLIKSLKESMGGTSGGSSSGSGLGSLVSGAASGIGEWIGSLFKFSAGGVMGPMGPMPLRRYAMGGVASSPQLAMFGEGSQPEAYVPLPDGRRIPVAMKGGGGTVIQNITIKTDNPAAVRASRGQMAADFSNQVGRLSKRWG